ncbi:CTP synthase [Truepera radiovictrix]|uniref:CTP synthase n=1 Tax=Truepera radiovictrix (strain DSM 17093 / CIP 108686 / LMG 22925 / RQ-24) TaxID=649638 RepID=D7CQT4_TRURR|nr:CTP synthase [Truepera radiovictrix]ADI15068.1 CTP synthase [Truepera radiovictrix DSM 17093]WMT56379.1 CTP synthase [Truepera radiovictrix]
MKETKYIFVTGGVVSSLGKGIVTSSLGALLRARGYRVTAVKIDPYINVDAGTMRPYEHGEVFVTADGAETDLDLGTYERFLDVPMSRANNITTGQVYLRVIERERAGEYLSQTVQVIPHVTDEIKGRIREAGRAVGAEVVLVEVGGTVGDIESLPFLEAIRQLRFEVGGGNALYLHVTLLPYLGTSEEFKTKPTQHSVATLRSVGIQPDGIVLRSPSPVPEEVSRKIALFTNVEARDVFNSFDTDIIYEVPEILEQQGLGRFVERRLELEKVTPELHAWHKAVRVLRNPKRQVTIGVVGKYVAMPDAYLSLTEALKHAGIANEARLELRWVSAEALVEGDLSPLAELDGILVPGGFGVRGIEGKVRAARYARERGVPYLGICLGMQIAVIEFARNVAGLQAANSTEFDPYTPHPVIDLMPEQRGLADTGGTMRLGDWPMQVAPDTRLHELYKDRLDHRGVVFERHRHRFEVNPAYVTPLQEAGLTVSGVTPGMAGRGAGLVEAVELPEHPFFVALQSHPEFGTRPMRPSPPFRGFVGAAVRYGEARAAREAGAEADVRARA